MKPAKEILELLLEELNEHLGGINLSDKKAGLYYDYNSILGNVSFLLAGLLQSILKKNGKKEDKGKWFDDSIITNITFIENTFIFDGVMIWGKDSGNQWTDLFRFEIELLQHGFSDRFIFYFASLIYPEILYEEFADNRHYWNDMDDEKWKYIIKSPEIIL